MEAPAESWERRHLRCPVQILASEISEHRAVDQGAHKLEHSCRGVDKTRPRAVLDQMGGRELGRMTKSGHRVNQKW